MILAANRQFFAKGPKIASDKLVFLYGRLKSGLSLGLGSGLVLGLLVKAPI